MIYALVETATGKLLSWTRSAAGLPDATTRTAKGWTIAEIADGDPSGIWNPEALRWDPRVAEPVMITEYQFKAKLTADERIGIRAAAETDPYVADFLDLLASADEVNLRDELVIGAVGYLTMRGLLTEERAAAVLA
jgi:hypothetical protein